MIRHTDYQADMPQASFQNINSTFAESHVTPPTRSSTGLSKLFASLTNTIADPYAEMQKTARLLDHPGLAGDQHALFPTPDGPTHNLEAGQFHSSPVFGKCLDTSRL
jgi:hypothetical protein